MVSSPRRLRHYVALLVGIVLITVSLKQGDDFKLSSGLPKNNKRAVAHPPTPSESHSGYAFTPYEVILFSPHDPKPVELRRTEVYVTNTHIKLGDFFTLVLAKQKLSIAAFSSKNLNVTVLGLKDVLLVFSFDQRRALQRALRALDNAGIVEPLQSYGTKAIQNIPEVEEELIVFWKGKRLAHFERVKHSENLFRVDMHVFQENLNLPSGPSINGTATAEDVLMKFLTSPASPSGGGVPVAGFIWCDNSDKPMGVVRLSPYNAGYVVPIPHNYHGHFAPARGYRRLY